MLKIGHVVVYVLVSLGQKGNARKVVNGRVVENVLFEACTVHVQQVVTDSVDSRTHFAKNQTHMGIAIRR